MLGFKVDFEKRIFGFDLLRAFAIFCVIHGHGRHLLHGTFLENFPWFRLPHGVDIFFVISGFMIGYSFLVNASRTNDKLTFSRSLNFWKRSALRILPNYYLILLINYLLVNNGFLNGSNEKFGLILFASFTQNLYYPFYDFFWESWSLATQEWFYLLFPLCIIFFGRFFKLKHSILIISLLFIAASIAYRLSISGNNYDSFWFGVNFRKVALSRVDSIFFGVIAAWFRFYFKEKWNKLAIPLFISGILMFIIVTYLPREINSFYSKVIFLSLAPIYISLWFPLIDRLKDIKGSTGKFITYFSILSYSMYLLNLLIIQIINKHFTDFLLNHTSIKYLLYWLITISLSYLLYVLYENPISQFGNKMLHTTKMMYKRIGTTDKTKAPKKN